MPRPHSAKAELPHFQFRISISSRYEKRHRDVSTSQTNDILFETLDENVGDKTKYDSGVNLIDSSYLIPHLQTVPVRIESPSQNPKPNNMLSSCVDYKLRRAYSAM